MCSNHVQYGQPREQDPQPSLFLKGYQCQARREPLARHDQPFRYIDGMDSGADLPTKTTVEYENEIGFSKQQNENAD